MNEEKIFDIAIIGAGPAGLSAAKKAASEGLPAIIFEEHAKVGEPVHCGECLSLYATKRMGLDLPPETIAMKVKGIRVVFPDTTPIIFREEGYALEKNLFEQYLAVLAQGAGAVLKTSARVQSLKRENGIWNIGTLAGNFQAKAIIDASGYQSIGSQLAGLNQQKFKTVMGVQYFMEDVPNDGYIEFFLWPRLAPEGYLWIIPKANGCANVGLVSQDGANIHNCLKQFIREKGLEGKKIIKPFGGAIPASGPLPKTYGDGIILAGDAAGFTSPMFEGGTQLALKSGELAAQTIARALKGLPKPSTPELEQMNEQQPEQKLNDPLSANALCEYENAWKAEFAPYEKLIVGKNSLYGLPEAELDKLGRILPGDLTNIGLGAKAGIAAKALLVFGSKVMKIRSALDTFAYSTGEMYGW